MGFRGPINQWINSYLTNRNQFVAIGETCSAIQDCKMGVPQGSTLGPLLFILYINDMCNMLTTLNGLHFADDSTLHAHFNKNENIAPEINIELSAVATWLNANKLYLNIDKTKYMIFSLKDTPPDLNLIIGNAQIQRTSVQKFLGVHIDDRLTFGEHTNKISTQISRSVGVMRRMRQIVPRDVLRQLFYAFIYSKYTYAITCYGSAYQNQVQRLKNLISRALKLVLNTETLTAELCKTNQIFDFDTSYKYFCCINMYKILSLNTHEFLAIKINSFQTNHSHETRASYNHILSLPFYRLSKCQRSFLYNGTKFWNELPINVRNIEDNLKGFKILLKQWLLS